MTPRFVFALFVTGKILTSCTDTIESIDVNNDRIFQSYQVRYFEESQYLSLTARFSVGGNTRANVKLISPSAVSVDGKPMAYHHGSESYYKLSNTEPTMAESYSFSWTKSSGDVLKNSVQMPELIAINSPEKNTSHSISESLTVKLTGEALKPNEQATVTIEGYADAGSIIRKVYQTVSNTMSVSFSPDELKSLPKGEAKISVSRWSHGDLQSCNPEVGGMYYSSWTSKDTSIFITD